MTFAHKLVGIIGACLLGALLTSCGTSADSAGTVDDAVTLLQDLNDFNVWETISDRLITLNDQTSYRATITLQSGPIAESGEIAAPPETDITVDLDVDNASNARVTLTENGQTYTYIVVDYSPDADPATTRIFRAEDSGFACVTEGDHVSLLQGGPYTLFTTYQVETIGLRTLAVVDRTDNEDAMVIEREAIEYDLVSKVDDALQIAAEFANDDLQAALDATGPFELSGDLYLDQDTLALLRVTILYADLATQQDYNLSFEVTQWGDVADITIPSDADSLEACN